MATVIEQLMKDISEEFAGPSRFCDIMHQGCMVATQKRLQEAEYQIIRGDYGNGKYLVVQRMDGYTKIHSKLSYPNL